MYIYLYPESNKIIKIKIKSLELSVKITILLLSCYTYKILCRFTKRLSAYDARKLESSPRQCSPQFLLLDTHLVLLYCQVGLPAARVRNERNKWNHRVRHKSLNFFV